MEFVVRKVGMSRTVGTKSIAVTLLEVVSTRVCCVSGNVAVVAYPRHGSSNKPVAGLQKKYGLSSEFNSFASVRIDGSGLNVGSGNLDLSGISGGKAVRVSFRTKGRGFSGVVKRWNFSGGPSSHGSRFHRRPGSIGNREWPGRVQPGKKMAGHYGNELVSVGSRVYSFDPVSRILVLEGSVPGHSGAYGRILIR